MKLVTNELMCDAPKFRGRQNVVFDQEARLAEEEANRKPVYEDKPIIAREWDSKTAAETAKEVCTFLTHSLLVWNTPRPTLHG